MKCRFIGLLKLTLIAFAANSTVSLARQLDVVVFDNSGAPLAEAIVSIPILANEPTQPSTAIVDQVDKMFVPFVLPVRPGVTINFPNSDNIRHQVYSFSEAKPFELPLYSNQEAPAITFDKPGLVVLGCNIHDGMRAYVLVSPYIESVVTDADGVATLSSEMDFNEVSVWYPGVSDDIREQVKVVVDAGQERIEVHLDVAKDQQERTELSPLQQRFNRRARTDG
ncbi:methylamine utilization protein [Pseudidiomarina taiwanensis]|uniref:Methylamine utilization protein n=1 Tax=Pseudidiomarina taiwanensis TaxID=337250 RepID=A0A432ZP00_9GAMM|nr:methylamine utilization protein [Pseudidiomarina taiwanensis]RUO79629.1 methylamine utilization protein [Pseudidiomarina taiwanensis]